NGRVAMPPGLDVPDSQLMSFAQLVRLSSKERGLLIESLRDAEPSLFGRTFAVEWMKKAKVTQAEASDMFRLLASLYVSMDIANETPESFAEAVAGSVTRSGDKTIQPKDGNWADFNTFLSELLTL